MLQATGAGLTCCEVGEGHGEHVGEGEGGEEDRPLPHQLELRHQGGGEHAGVPHLYSTAQYSTVQYSTGAPHLLLLPRGVGDHHPVWGVAGEDDGEVCEGGHGAAADHSSFSDYLL